MIGKRNFFIDSAPHYWNRFIESHAEYSLKDALSIDTWRAPDKRATSKLSHHVQSLEVDTTIFRLLQCTASQNGLAVDRTI